MKHVTSQIIIFLFLVSFSLGLDDVVDCGGFVRPSKQLSSYLEKVGQKLNFTTIKVHLLTLEGIKKFSSECAPNGYFIIPVYDRGTFLIKIEGPPGWTFNTPQVRVIVGPDSVCNHNFELTGFSILGKVSGESTCKNYDRKSPQNVTLKLTSLVTSSVVEEIRSNDDGSYQFSNVFPGKYLLEASRPNWKFESNKMEVEVKWNNLELESSFVVIGYDISGKVLETSEFGEPVKDVYLLLYSDTKTDIECQKVNVPLPSDRNTPVCSTQTNENGEFQFDYIPCGSYKLVPYYKSSFTTYDVIPKETILEVDQESINLVDPFLVKGFSVHGKVLSSNNEGIEGVTVIAVSKENFERRAVSDANGHYTLDQITSGDYAISVEKAHFTFTSHESFKITHSTTTIPDLFATKYHICGRVHISQPPTGVKADNRKIVLKSENKGDVTTTTDQTGSFCFSVISGKYVVVPEVTTAETEAGLLLTDSKIEVRVESQPVLDVNFEQARLTVSGRVKCIESPCDTSISVSLSAIGRTTRVTTGLALVHDSSEDDHFIFKGILPGKYEVTINHESWCWEKESETIEVTTKDQTDIKFVQTGYEFVARSSHEVDLYYSEDSSKEITDQDNHFHLKTGANKYCLSKPGVYKMEPRSCFRFESDVYSYDTSNPFVLKLQAQNFLLQGTILLSDTTEISDIAIEVQSSISKDGDEPEKRLKIKKIDDHKYEFKYWAELEEKVTFVPSSKSQIYFYPRNVRAEIVDNSCPPPLPVFQARPGKYLKGSVSPASKEITIHVLYSETLEPALPPIKTNSKGLYEAGPLYDDQEYVVRAESEGFHLKEEEGKPGHFLVRKLGHVEVSVQHDSKPLPGVLLSLSGSDGYRSNNATDGSGKFRFGNLFPGEYYLRPLLREYSFSPSAIPITIIEGEESHIEFSATRVAYVCSGRVSSLSGDIEKSVTVEAIGPNGLYEETQPDPNGFYRLRGLLPAKPYVIKIKPSTNTKISYAEPRDVKVTIGTEDLEHVNFIAFRKNNFFDVMGTVDTQQDSLTTLTAQIYNNQQKPPVLLEEQKLGPVSNIFSFFNLDPSIEYLIKLKTDLSEKVYEYQLPSTVISGSQADSAGMVYINFGFKNTIKQMHVEVDQGSFATLIFFVVAGFLLYYRNEVMNFTQTYFPKERSTSRFINDWSSDWSKKKKKNK